MRSVPALCATVAILLLASGCSSDPPTSTSGPTTLVLAHLDNDLLGDPAAQWFIDEVADVSGGALQIEFANECCGRDADNQSVLANGVASGDFDLGWLAVRGLEDLGVTAFRGLEAPLLIDRYAAEAAVLDSEIPASLLPALDALKITGIAIEPGMLRRPISSGTVLNSPADFAGLVFWTVPSSLSAASLAALGAAPSQVANDERNSGLEDGSIDAAENSIFWQVSTQHVPDPVITRNLALWPRFSALVANPEALARLSEEQTGWLQKAADAVARRAMDVAAVDAAVVDDYCAAGGKLSVVPSRAEWDAALEPVYAELESDPQTSALLEEIRSVIPDREEVENELNPPADCYR